MGPMRPCCQKWTSELGTVQEQESAESLRANEYSPVAWGKWKGFFGWLAASLLVAVPMKCDVACRP